MILNLKTKIALLVSVGSNFPKKAQYLKQSAQCIKKELGIITAFSKVYQTPSWGFEGEDFYNACFCIETLYSTQKSLEILQSIEKQLGRISKTDQNQNYKDRPIDLDIIASSEGVFHYKELTVPHLLMHQRRFVLTPLADIAPDWKHPLLHQDVYELLESCEDTSDIKKVDGFEW